jgi:hypothetical protein
MRVLATWILAVGLAAAPVMAAGRTDDNDSPAAKANANKDAAAKSATSDAPANAAKPAAAKPAAAKSNAPANADPAAMEGELEQLRNLLEAQAKQLQEQNDELKEQQKQMQMLEKQLNGTTASTSAPSSTRTPSAISAASAPSAAGESSSIAPAYAASIAPVGTAAVSNTPISSAASAGGAQEADEPTSWRFKGVTFTPMGFFAAETVWRQRAMSADVNTPFSSDPLPGSSAYNLSEFNASGRQSRIAMLVQGRLHSVNLSGYYEADFLSSGTTSNDNQTNSYTLRQRQFWAQAAFDNGWTITGGQMWSLVTQTAKGVDNRTEVLPETIDAQYSVGFSWARQYGMRFSKNFNDKFWLALSVEEPQITFKSSGTTTPFLFGEAGTNSGLYNTTANYSFNLTPDFVVKAVWEPGFGHYEVFGLVSTFRDRIFPTGAVPYNDKTAGGGGGANAWFPFDHSHVNFGLHALVGDGVGRYGSAQAAPDVTVRPDGTFAPIRSYQGLGTLAFHYPKWDVYFHVGEEYAARTEYISGSSTIPNEGFGAIGFNDAGCWTEVAPGSGGYAIGALADCSNNIRDIIEGTAGVWYSFYSGPKGTIKFGLQYSHEAYNTWEGLGSTGTCSSTANPSCAPSTNENMVFTSMRYYIP